MEIEAVSPEQMLLGAYLDLYPAEAAELLESAEIDDVTAIIETQSVPRACAILEQLSEHLSTDCLRKLKADALRPIVPQLDPSRAAVLFSRLEPERREKRLAQLDPFTRDELREIMSYPVDSAGHLMDTRILTFQADLRVHEALDRLRAWRDIDLDDLLIVDADGKLVGMLGLAEVALAPPRRRLEGLIKAPPPRIHGVAPRDDVLAALDEGKIDTLPVVDGQDRLLGMIQHDAIVQAVREEATADLATLVGAGKEELALSPAMYAVRKRLPWLNINLVTAFAAASVVGLFENTIAQFTALAVLLPVVAGQSGNTGAQALAVIIRGLALREIRTHHWIPVLIKEAIVGAVNGVAIAVVTAIGVYLWSKSLGLCLVIFLAMILSMAIAGVCGAGIPLLLTALRQDPAQSGSIILTTVTDIVGFFSFLGLATVFSRLL